VGDGRAGPGLRTWGIFVSIAYPDLGDHYARMFAIPAIAFLHTAGGAALPPSSGRSSFSAGYGSAIPACIDG